MSGIYDRLQKKLEVQPQWEGISPLDIAGLPSNLKKLMRLLLRESELNLSELRSALEDDLDDLTLPDLESALKELTRQGWLIERGEGERRSYLVNLRRRKGAQGVWKILRDRLEGSE